MTTRNHNQGLAGGARKRAPERPVIAPEALRAAPDGKTWRVERGAGSVSLAEACMLVPLTDSPEDRHVRIHELLHTRVTPADYLDAARTDKRSWEATQAAEDGRLGMIARKQGLDAYTTTGPITAQEAEEKLGGMLRNADDETRWHRAVALAAAAYGTALQPVATRAVLNAAQQADSATGWAIRRCIEEIGDTYRSHDAYSAETSIAVARIIDQLLPPKEGPADTDEDSTDGTAETDETNPSQDTCQADASAVHPVRPPLTIRGTTRARSRRRTIDGGRLTRPLDTLQPDGGRPFTRNQRTHGGVVVIDTSGSMHPDHDHIRQLVAGAPGALIVTYSSHQDNGKTIAYVVGERGRIVAPKDLVIGGGNRNDASVLAWADANGTPGPRIWVSDGFAGDAQGQITPGSITYTAATARRLGYTRVPTILAALRGDPA